MVNLSCAVGGVLLCWKTGFILGIGQRECKPRIDLQIIKEVIQRFVLTEVNSVQHGVPILSRSMLKAKALLVSAEVIALKATCFQQLSSRQLRILDNKLQLVDLSFHDGLDHSAKIPRRLGEGQLHESDALIQRKTTVNVIFIAHGHVIFQHFRFA